MAAATPDDSCTAQIARASRNSFESFVEARTPLFPGLRERMAADPWFASRWLWPARWLGLGDFGARGHRYVFLNARHRDLLAGFDGGEALVVGGPADRRIARDLRMPFCWQADLYLAARELLFGGSEQAAAPVLARWRRFFAAQADPCYLVVGNDTSPISLLLVQIAATCPNTISVCLQHGLFNDCYHGDDIEGRNSDLNLVYDASQRAEMLRRLPRARVGVMGYPARLPSVAPMPEPSPRVVLVGTGEVERPHNYALSLQRYADAALALRAAGYQPEYRPHPSEREPVPLPGAPMPVRREAKAALLGGPRKVFVGFNSTLLYEAHCFGHLVVVLDDPKLPGYALSPFGQRLPADRMVQLPALIAAHYAQAGLPVAGELRARFEAGLREAEDRAAPAGHSLSSVAGAGLSGAGGPAA
jgi:hypothetical protein